MAQPILVVAVAVVDLERALVAQALLVALVS
jgi:hypothetical protein